MVKLFFGFHLFHGLRPLSCHHAPGLAKAPQSNPSNPIPSVGIILFFSHWPKRFKATTKSSALYVHLPSHEPIQFDPFTTPCSQN